MSEKFTLLSHQKLFIFTGATLMFLGVGAGAFGAHFLKSRLDQSALTIFEVGVRYQHYHALGMIILGAIYGIFPSTYLNISFWSMLIGVIIFSGSLYILSLTGIKYWGAVTPIGGVLLLIGWFCLMAGMIKS